MDKTWYTSKGVWLGVLTILLGSLEVVKEAVIVGDWSSVGIITMVLGILKVVERVTRV